MHLQLQKRLSRKLLLGKEEMEKEIWKISAVGIECAKKFERIKISCHMGDN